MKNIFKAFTIMILALIVCIPMQTIVKASTVTNMQAKKDVVVSKPWTVNFNKDLNASTVNTTNIKVLSDNNAYIEIKVSLASNNKSIVVEPVKNYEYNKTYTLIVTNQVKSSDGKLLPSEVRMDFTTKSAPTKPSEVTVCIDPGQYYKVITAANGVKAKNINLSTALKLGSLLKTRGFNVVYTRSTDAVTWTQSGEDVAKALIAKNAKADVFISINTNSYTSSTSNGIETYYSSNVTQSKSLATPVQSELIKATSASDRGIKVGSSDANFAILNKTSCPTIVTELGFITNASEAALLCSDQYRNNAAKAIANGLMTYAGFANTDTTYATILKVSSAADIAGNVTSGAKYTFPTTTAVTMSDGSKQTFAVTWLQSSVTLSAAGAYTYYGTIKDSNVKVKAIVTVKASTTAKKYKIVLDAGHGGVDPGAIGPTHVYESTVNLAITLKVGAILNRNNVDTVYTRTTNAIAYSSNETQNLQYRCDVSNAAKPNYFVCIHANSAMESAHGTESYYYSGNAYGLKLAQAVQTEIIKATGSYDRGIKTANFYVLKNMTATSILIETGFITNASEEKLLNSATYQNKMAKGIATGILKTLGITTITY